MQNKEQYEQSKSQYEDYCNILKSSAVKIVRALGGYEDFSESAFKQLINDLMTRVSPHLDLSQVTEYAVDAYAKFYKLVAGAELFYQSKEMPTEKGILSIPNVCAFVNTILDETGTRERVIGEYDDSNSNVDDLSITSSLMVVADLLSQVYNTMSGIAFTFVED